MKTTSIEDFKKSKKTTTDFIGLKVNKGDTFSGLSKEKLEERIPQDSLNQIRTYCSNEMMSDYVCSLRWFLRGLDTYDAVKKSVVDNVRKMAIIGYRVAKKRHKQ